MGVGLLAVAREAGADTGRADAAIGTGDNAACPNPDRVASQAADRFTDVDADDSHAATIGCLVYYGITAGAGDGSRFDPDRAVDRWQMALFMTRAAKRAGVVLPSEGQGFTDLEGLNRAVIAGVNAAAALGIMPGTGATEFSPDDPVLRGDMALHLVRLLDLLTDTGSPINVAVDDATGDVTMTRPDGSRIVSDDSFDDVAALGDPAVENAVNAIYELGVTAGKSDGSYDPEGRVKRSDMAAFIIRALGHSGLRPDGPITLPPWRPPAPDTLPPDPEGVYEGDPLHLIAHASFERAYSLPDDDGDVLEVWLCNTPESGRRYSTHEDNRHNPANYATKFASQVTAWFEWLSGGLYTPVFRAGGVVDVGRSADYYGACDEEVLSQDFSGKGDIDGAVVVVGSEVPADGIIGAASCGFFSQRGFPDNRRSILVNGDAFSDPTVLAHEMGHALCWPHSYSGETVDDDGEVFEYDNPMDIMGWGAVGESDLVPMIGTNAVNRYAAGWIPVDQVRIHKEGTTARYELVPPGEDGVQFLVIPGSGEDDDRLRYWALGARVAGSGGQWWSDSDLPAEGVEMYIIDQSVFGCVLPDREYCYGMDRRTEPVFDPDDGYDLWEPSHVMAVVDESWWRGEAGSPSSVEVELVETDGKTFTVEVRPHVEEPEPTIVGDWEVDTGSRTAGDYTFAHTWVDIGSEASPDLLSLTIRCTAGSELDLYLWSSHSFFSGTPILEYRFGGQISPMSLEMVESISREAGFLDDDDLPAFVRQLRADTSGVLYVDLWDRPTYGGAFDHQAGGVLGIVGVDTQVEPILQQCGY